MNRAAIFLCMTVLLSGATALADVPQLTPRTIRIQGRDKVTVTTPTITLGDLADISSRAPNDDDAVIALRKVAITAAPAPGKELTLSGSEILEKLEAAGVNVDGVGYLLPRSTTVSRAARLLTLDEIRAAVEQAVSASGREITIKEIAYKNDVNVTPGTLELKAVPLATTSAGRMAFEMQASAPGDQPARFKIEAAVDEWREIPVANRPIVRGTLVGAEDVVMARFNLGQLPKGTALAKEGVLGLETKRDISFGEIFRTEKLIIPPTVAAGSKVTMVYRSSLFEATASGIALDGGATGQSIKVRNDASKKIVIGTITEPGMVLVSTGAAAQAFQGAQ